ncbi:hypothetical protein Trichorick_00329 [Candidatus Trichorickettsia mobilis]|uniref:Uncharacterized protein n=1 Tax=Candidatus Trichorickettsia mobilis TaxID=1346319 RepID=A0ABZ0UQX3_9RICK|nr:hypothetical protein [Candidatus Trichorickettsia mobilis]WPY00452.1 hypothetical protein Trichorick_00329 [Candidatus Trichorickettsia mobilis]
MKRYHNISDILNTIPNSYVASYKAQQRAETDEVIAIHQKYGIFPYPGTCKSISLYDKEVTDMGITLLENINKTINTCVTIKKGQQYDSWDYSAWELRAKICNTPGIHTKTNEFKKHLEFYKAQLSNYASQIAKSSSMADADQIAVGMTKYHDDHIGTLYAESRQALDDFQVDIMGVNVVD